MRTRTDRRSLGGWLTGAGSVIAVLLVVTPTAVLLLRAPWGNMVGLLSAPEVLPALRLSLLGSLAATALSALLGLPLAWLLARRRFPGRRLLRALVTLPMVLPPVVGGVGLLLAFGRNGLVGRPIDQAFGVSLPFTTAGVVVAVTFVALPFMVITAEAAFRAGDLRLEEAAATLGASRSTILRRVTLPLAGPTLAAGAVLTWARALGEFGATITFAGNFPGRTQTSPVKIFLLLEQGQLDAAVALSVVLLLVSITVLVVLRDRWLGAT